MLLGQKAPSVNWEPVPLDPSAQLPVWAWYRPPAIPYGVMFVIPPQIFADPGASGRLTIRQLVLAAGIAEERIVYWGLSGITYDAAGGMSPLLDQILPAPPEGVNLEVSVWIEPSPQFAAPVAPAMPMGNFAAGSGGTDHDRRLLGSIESTWNTILQLETRITSIRKELGSNISRLNSLNRDLNSDERRACDSKDIQAWTDARRWLRDSLSTLSRSVKEIDVGTTSGAGQRHKFEEIYKKYVVTGTPFPELAQTVNQFETYLKTIQSLMASAQANMTKAGRDAEQRASAVLTRIATKVRSMRR